MSTMSTKVVGNVSEAKVLAALLEVGYDVLLPFGAHPRYDMVVDREGEFYRIQCKTGRLKQNGCIDSSVWGSAGCYTKEDVEFVAIYCPEVDEVFLVPIGDVTPSGAMNLRVGPTGNGQKKGIMWAKDYQLSRSI